MKIKFSVATSGRVGSGRNQCIALIEFVKSIGGQYLGDSGTGSPILEVDGAKAGEAADKVRELFGINPSIEGCTE